MLRKGCRISVNPAEIPYLISTLQQKLEQDKYFEFLGYYLNYPNSEDPMIRIKEVESVDSLKGWNLIYHPSFFYHLNNCPCWSSGVKASTNK